MSACPFVANDTGAGVWKWAMHDEFACVFCSSLSTGYPVPVSSFAVDGLVSDSVRGHRVVLCLCDLITPPHRLNDVGFVSDAMDPAPSMDSQIISCSGSTLHAPVVARSQGHCDDCRASEALVPNARHEVDICVGGHGVFDCLCSSWFPSLLHDFTLVRPLHPSVRVWLSNLPQAKREEHRLYHVYVDGTGLSDCRRSPAWGLAVFQGSSVDDMTYVGFAGGLVAIDTSDAAYIGATSADSVSAELSAFVWAMLYIIACVPIDARCEILYDSEYAAGAVSSSARISTHSDLSRIASSLYHVISIRTDISLSHIKSHWWQPGNEFVDCIADAFSNGSLAWEVTCPLGPLIQESGFGLQWAFLDVLRPDWREAYPPLSAGKLCYSYSSLRPLMAIPADILTHRIDSWFADSLDFSPCDVRACPVRVMTFNVNSLARKNGIDRRRLLYEHLCMDHVHIACLQETRCTKSMCIVDGSFVRVTSAAEKGSYGCEIMISCDLPFAHNDKGPLYVGVDDVSVVFRSPRCLVVLVSCTALRVAVVCAHAPHSKVEASQLFWNELRGAVMSFVPAGCEILTCADVNGVIAPFASSAVGDTAASSATSPLGSHFVSFCDEFGLYLPVTFSANSAPHAELTTFVTSDGEHETQQDFIGVSSSVYCIPASCDVWRHIDIMHVRDDHFPVVVDVRFANGGLHKQTVRRRARLRPRCMLWTDAQKQHIRLCLQSLPPVPWYVEPDSHLFMLMQRMHTAIESLPTPQPTAKQKYISSVTLDSIRMSYRALRCCHASRRKIRRAALWAVFGAWSSKLWRCRWSDVRGFADKSLCYNSVFSHYAARFASASTAAYTRLDWCVHVSDMADRASSVLSGSWDAEVFALVRGMRKRSAPKPGRLSTSSGSPATSYQEERCLVRTHFASALNGRNTSLSELLCRARERRMSTPSPVSHADPALLPSVADVIRLLRTASKFKAVGEDRIGGDVWAMFADILGPHLHSLFVKSVATVTTPLAWKGGMLMELWKGKGSTSDISAYRDILIQDHPAKLHGAVLRPVLRAIAEVTTRSTQWGSGLHAGSTEVAHLTIRSMIDIARLRRESGAIVFLDVVSAFASFRRRIVLCCEASDEQWVLLLVSLGFSDSEAKAVVSDACSLLLWQTTGASEHLLALLGEMYTDTWLSTEGLDGVVHFDSGSMAGTALADLVFAVAMSKVLKSFHDRLSDAGLAPSVPCRNPGEVFGGDAPTCLHCPVVEVSFVDDVAVPVLAPAASLTSSVASVASIACEVFAAYGLKLNFQPGKSEAMFFWGGVGAERSRRVFSIDNECSIRVEGRAAFALPVCRSYKHLGTRCSFATNLAVEVSARASMILQDVRVFRRRVLANPDVPLPKRLALARVVLMSRGLFQSGTWSVLDGHPYRKMHHAVMSVYRALTNQYWNGNTSKLASDNEVLLQLGAPSLGMLIKVARLQLFARIVRKLPSALLCALCAAMPLKSSWLSSIQIDLKWLATVSSCVRVDSTLADWSAFIRANTKSFLRVVHEMSFKFGAIFVPSKPSRTIASVGM